MPRLLLLALVLGALLPALRAQPSAQAPGSRRIEGRVVADDTGDPIPHAKVGISTASASRATLTDQNGRFLLEVPAGIALVTVTKTGYARREVAVPSGGSGVAARLSRSAAIAGRVIDGSGEPAVNVAVRAEVPPASGRTFSVVAVTVTDDRGEFRLAGLAEGRVAVSVQAIPGVNATLYFPGVVSAAEAELLEVKAGDELERINLALPAIDNREASGGVVIVIPTPPLRAPGPGEMAVAVRGRVVSATGGVIGGARVRLTQQTPRAGAVTQSDRDGRFEFAGVVPGPFLIAATKTGFSSLGPGIGRPIAVTSTGADTELTLTPWGSVSGRVLDEAGDPVQGAAMQLLRIQFQNGRRRLVSAGLSRTTDDRGTFRIFGVPPGQYILSASAGEVSTAELPGYVRTYFPGVADAASSPLLTIGAGQSQSGADVTLVRQRTVRVAGIVRDAQGLPGLVGSLNLIPSQSASSLALSAGARVDRSGAFEFPNVPPGRYVIQAYRGARNRATEGEFGALPVTVGDGDLEGLTVQATAGSVIAGRVSFIGAAPGAAPARGAIDIEAVPSDPDLAPISGRATADIGPDWSFVLSGISGPRRIDVTRTPPGWALKEVRVRGIDVTDRPLAFGTVAQSIDDVEVMLTDRVTRVAGRVRSRAGGAPAGAAVVAFAPYRDRWFTESRYMRAAAVGADGGFNLEGLPAGSYYLAAVAALPAGGPDAWRDPAFLESLVAPATSVSLGEGSTATVNLEVVETR